jgi:hypothetical protein
LDLREIDNNPHLLRGRLKPPTYYYAELLPAAVQTGLCAAVAIMATRRCTPNATIVGGGGVLAVALVALDASTS